MIIIESKRKKAATILKKYPDAVLADVTSSAKDGLVKLSPFYPHGGIPVPFSEEYTATCVEAIWQGLKVFEGCDVDTSLFANNTMKGLKRTVRKYGKPLGHRKGVNGTELLDYIEANAKKPLSHASLIKAYVEGIYPYEDVAVSHNNTPKGDVIELDLFKQ